MNKISFRGASRQRKDPWLTTQPRDNVSKYFIKSELKNSSSQNIMPLKTTLLLLMAFMISNITVNGQKKTLALGIVGLSHGHAHWVFQSAKKGDFTLAGIVEPDMDVVRKYAKQYGFAMELVFPTMERMIEKTQPQAVAAFGNIYDHLKIVEVCAPKGIHVMVEKPLAASLAHAKKMEALARKHKIHLLTNYETTWYPTNHEAYAKAKEQSAIGDIKKVIVRDGHKGPKNIGVEPEFLSWLTDPVLNGGGAVMDFGCYGANLLTWLMQGKKPLEVMAVTQQLQPENNPNVDDEANIVLTYADAVGIIHASWNWPIGRKDMEIYGKKGAIYADDRYNLRIRMAEGYDGYSEERLKLPERTAPYDDPFAYFAAVIHNEIQMPPYDLSSLENNMVVMEILDAAIRSAKSNKAVKLRRH
jgi:predicted dehydrogenase